MKSNPSKYKKILVKIGLFALSFIVGMLIAKGVKSQEDQNGLLWKISGNGLEKPSYLYGTIHIICAEDFTFDESKQKAFEATDITVFEIDMDDPELMPNMQALMVNANGSNFKDQLKGEQSEQLEQALKNHLGMGLDQLGIYKPFAVMSMCVQSLIQCPATISYEDSLSKLSARQGKEVIGLETAEQQFGYFEDIPVQEQADWLIEMLTEKEQQTELFNQMSIYYQKEELESLFATIIEDPQFKNHRASLIDQRNANWIGQLKKIMHEQPAFIAVGAGHLPSNKGVIDLLKAEGYKVEVVR